MPDDLTFLMGKFAARLPGWLRYARNHMWCRTEGERHRFGFTAYAVRLMQDVYFLDWSLSAGDEVHLLQEIGHIETSKAESDLFAPAGGRIVTFNAELLKDPTPINLDLYGAGWLFEMEGDTAHLMSVTEYNDFLAGQWEKTQRVIKGKINEE